MATDFIKPPSKSKSGGGARKIRSSANGKYARYRALIGKPRGPGVAGNKSGAKWRRRDA